LFWLFLQPPYAHRAFNEDGHLRVINGHHHSSSSFFRESGQVEFRATSIKHQNPFIINRKGYMWGQIWWY